MNRGDENTRIETRIRVKAHYTKVSGLFKLTLYTYKRGIRNRRGEDAMSVCKEDRKVE